MLFKTAIPLFAAAIAAHGIEPAQLRDFAQRLCTECHGAKKQKGEFDLEPYLAKPDFAKDAETWSKVAEILHSHDMPPKEKPQPTDDERRAVVQWLEKQLAANAASDPGRVTIRRLNNEEYRNTIRDLLAVDFSTEEFPQDETAHGFDTNADALTLPPLLMERYLDAAGKIVAMAFDGNQPGPPRQKLPPASFKSPNDFIKPREDGVLGFNREGEAIADVKFSRDGEYLIRIRAFGEQAGPEPPELALGLDGARLETFAVKAAGKSASYEKKFTTTAGTRKLSFAYLNNYNEPNHPDPKMRGDRNVFIASVELTGPLHIIENGSESFQRVFTRLPEKGAEAETGRELIAAFASRAWRRPLNSGEADRLGRLVAAALADKAPFTEAVGVGVQAVLCSPAFLFRSELDPGGMKPGETRRLTAHEAASRLSYFLWSTMPDAELRALADSGALLRDGNLEKQTARMLRDPRARALTHNFSSQWLQLRAMDEVDIDRRRFPKFNGRLRDAMAEESRLFFNAIVSENRPVFDLIEADFTFVNRQLAEHYGLPAPSGEKFERISLPSGSPRGGVLGQAAVHLSTSMPTRTSPVIRGKWVLEQILGTPPPPPSANVPPLEDAKVDKDAPLRVRLEQHRANADCAGCHARIDPVGFALENFDATGAWRTQDGAAAIDTAGVLPDGTKLGGFTDLRRYLKSEKFARAFTENLVIYALGRELRRADKKAVDAILARAKTGDYRMTALIEAIVTSDPFLMRRR